VQQSVLSCLQHPRSSWLRGLLPSPEEHFKIMAKVRLRYLRP
jgi:hypothetical protein